MGGLLISYNINEKGDIARSWANTVFF